MKIKSIAAICKKEKWIVLYEKVGPDGEPEQQYISDGRAIYPLFGLPYLEAESILTIFDIPEKQRDKWTIKAEPLPGIVNLNDTDPTEKIVQQSSPYLLYNGKTLKPLYTSHGLVFIDSDYLTPLYDVLDVLELYEREATSGRPYIVAKAGFLLQAVIMPYYDAISDKFVEKLQELTRQCAYALREVEERRRCEESKIPKQPQTKVDPSTGEIINMDESEENEDG